MLMILQDDSIGKNIKRLRNAKNWTQEQTVAKLQIKKSIMDQTTLAKIEAGVRNIKVSDLKAFKEIFNVSFDEFFKD